MTHPPLVSVIVIFLNAERFIREAVESVFAQTYSEWELLFVDDGSSDSSTYLAVDYANRHPERVRYLEHPGHCNRGMSVSRNLGLRHAQGSYVAFLDADDVWYPGKLAEQVAILEAVPSAGMIYGHALIWHSWTGRSEDEDKDYTYDLGVPANTLIPPPYLLPVLLKNSAQTPMTSNAMLRRSVVESVRGFEDVFTGMYEDQVFFSKIELCSAVYVARACWLKYRQHADSHTAIVDRSQQYITARKPFLDWIASYLKSQEVPPDSPVWKALNRELRRVRYPFVYRVLNVFLRSLAGARAVTMRILHRS